MGLAFDLRGINDGSHETIRFGDRGPQIPQGRGQDWKAEHYTIPGLVSCAGQPRDGVLGPVQGIQAIRFLALHDQS